MPVKAPAFQFYPKDWLTSETTRKMTLAERGVYIELLAYSWMNEPQGSLPSDLRIVSRFTGISLRIISKFTANYPKTFSEVSGRLVNQKLASLSKEDDEYHEKASTYGKLGAERRWGTHNNKDRVAILKNGSASSPAFASANLKPLLLPASPLDVKNKLVEICKIIPESDRKDSRLFHDAVEVGLVSIGCVVTREWKVADRGDGVPGFIDLVVTEPVKFALELDRVTPRQKSIFKLSRFGLGFVLLREGFQNVVSLTEVEKKADKKTTEAKVEARIGSGPEIQIDLNSERQKALRTIREDYARLRRAGQLPEELRELDSYKKFRLKEMGLA